MRYMAQRHGMACGLGVAAASGGGKAQLKISAKWHLACGGWRQISINGGSENGDNRRLAAAKASDRRRKTSTVSKASKR
jgi:hypothetical protein